MSAALRSYQAALGADPGGPLPLLGAAQLALLRRDGGATNAVTLLERALRRAPAWTDALALLAPLYDATPERAPGAEAEFAAAAARVGATSVDKEAHAEFLARRGALKDADAEYTAAVAAAREEAKASGKPLSVRLLNNAACAVFRASAAPRAAALLEEALAASSDPTTSDVPASSSVTLGYNRARVLEVAAGPAAGAAEHAALFAAFPDYADAAARLAALAAASGDITAAEAAADAAVAADPSGGAGGGDAVAAVGRAHLLRRNWRAAETAFRRLKSLPACSDDPYATLGLAAVALHSAPGAGAGDARKRAKHLAKAAELYTRVLEADATNALAACGLGATLAEQRHLAAARDVLTLVVEACAAVEGGAPAPDADANRAAAALGDPAAPDAAAAAAASARLYDAALKGASADRRPGVAAGAAFAHYLAGDVASARRALLRCAHADPGDAVTVFNIALTLQSGALATLKQERAPGDAGRLPATRAAVADLATARSLFARLAAASAAARATKSSKAAASFPPSLDHRKLTTHVEFCDASAQKAAAVLADAEAEAAAIARARAPWQKPPARRTTPPAPSKPTVPPRRRPGRGKRGKRWLPRRATGSRD